MNKSLHLLLTILLLSNTYLVLGQQATFNKVELPYGSLLEWGGGIAQDNNGYMWLATKGGLYRYDGYQFKIYANDPSDPHSISTMGIENVYADPNGIIWVVTYVNGVDRLDPVTGKFTHFRHQPNDPGSLSSDTVRAILVDREGTLWIGTQRGLDRFDPKAGNFKHYQHNPKDPNSLSCNQVRKIYEDKQGTLWVGTGSIWKGEGGETEEGGLNRFDKKTGKFIRYINEPGNPLSLINNKVQAIFEDSRGTFWVGTAGDGLHSMDRRAGTFHRHLYEPANPQGLSRPPVNEKSPFTDHITFITEDALGSVWIGTLGNGLTQYDPEVGKTEHYRKGTKGFMENSAWASCNSKDGILWISTWEGELYRMDPYRKNISHVSTPNPVVAFSEDAADQLWIGTAQGIAVKNKKSNVYKSFAHDPSDQNTLSDNSTRCLFRDREGFMWVGTANGLNRFNAQNNTFTRWQNNPGDSSSISAGSVNKIIEAGDDFLWIGTSSGLDLMNKRTGTFTHYKNNANDNSSLSRNFVLSIVKDSSDNLWVGTALGGGLNYFDRKSGKFKHFLKGKSVPALIQDSGGVVWVGADDGLYWTNNPVNGFTRFVDPGSSMERFRVGSIQEDDRKNLWVRTPAGIYKFNPRNKQLTFYSLKVSNRASLSDLLNSGLLSLTNSYKGKNGEFYFADGNGYSVFPPDKLISNPNPPHVVLTDFRLKGKSVQPGTDSPLTEPLQYTKRISLSYNQNIFSFDFAGIHFSSPEHNRQLYRLENYDLEWREADAQKTAYYYNVPPGRYAFRVKAASSGGVWTEKAIPIVISPPWRHTWWAYSLYGVFFITSVYAVHRYQKQRVIASERERARVRELEQAKEIENAYLELKFTQAQLIQKEKMASLGELTAGIAHEIQNPLNFVNNFSEVSSELVEELRDEKKKAVPDPVVEDELLVGLKQNLQKIHHHSQRGDAIVKNMLQHSRSTSGEKQLTNLNELAEEYLRLAYYGVRAKDKDFTCTLQNSFDQNLEKVEAVPQEIGRVLLNLYNNAFYAVQQKLKLGLHGYQPKVMVNTQRKEGQVEIRVWDNGTGISESVESKIFQPFFTTKPTGQGTGLGLSLSYDIITKGHGGEMRVASEEGEWSEFTVSIPVPVVSPIQPLIA